MYTNLEALLKEHDEDTIFRAAMNHLAILDNAKWRREYIKKHGHYPSIELGRENFHQSKYYLPPSPKYRPIPRDLAIEQLRNCADNNDCRSCQEGIVEFLAGKNEVPCHDCGHPCAMNKHGDVVCTNAACFLFNT